MNEMASRAAILVFVLTGTAAAQEARPPQEVEAEEVFREAEEAYQAERWAQAAQLYTRSHALLTEIRHPRRGWVAYNIGRSWEHLPGRERDALRAYEMFLAETPEDSSDATLSQQRSEARARIAELRARGVSGAGGTSPVGPIVMGLGGALLIAAIGTGAAALVRHGELAADCDDATCPSSQRDAWSELEALAITTDVLLPTSLVAIAAGLVLTLVLSDEGGSASAVCGPSGCRLGGTF